MPVCFLLPFDKWIRAFKRITTRCSTFTRVFAVSNRNAIQLLPLIFLCARWLCAHGDICQNRSLSSESFAAAEANSLNVWIWKAVFIWEREVFAVVRISDLTFQSFFLSMPRVIDIRKVTARLWHFYFSRANFYCVVCTFNRFARFVVNILSSAIAELMQKFLLTYN